MMFLELLESETEELNEQHEEMLMDFLESAYGDDYEAMQEELGLTDEELEDLKEQLVRRVSSTGQVTKVKSKKIRTARATMTTGMSRAALKQRARKSSRTKRANPNIARKALKKRKKALKRRKMLGIK